LPEASAMKSAKLSGVILLVVFLNCFWAANLFGQCGIYFKTMNREIFPGIPFFVPENSPSPRLLKDVTGDGRVDMIARSGIGNVIFIAPGEGSGNFGQLSFITLPPPSTSATHQSDYFAEDFTNDGINDILVELNTSPATYVIYRSNGDGSFTALPATTLTSGFEEVQAIVDINNDHYPDLMLGNRFRLANADGTFGLLVGLLGGMNLSYAGEFSGDGRIDFVQEWNGTTLRIAYNMGGGNFTFGPDLGTIGANAAVVAVRDFNNDGITDILARSSTEVAVLTGLVTGSFSKTAYPLNQQIAQNFHVADFTGDGFPDILMKPSSSALTQVNPTVPAAFLINNGAAGGFTAATYAVPVRGFPVGDLDGDNKADFMLFNNNMINASTNSGMVFGETQIHFQKNVCKKPTPVKKVDFDGDNMTDKTFFRAADGRWRFKRSSDGLVVSFNWGLSGDIPAPGDYDGDGKTDVAVFRPSDGTWYIVNSSNGSFGFINFGLAGDKPAASDYDGDGTSDIAVFRPSDGNWYIYYTGTGQVSITHFGIGEDKPVPEDYDGDGRTDIAVYRPSTGIWYYLKSTDGNFAALNWGIATDLPVPADYDGDGKSDIAVYRASENNWYILRSYDYHFSVGKYGIAGDVPQWSDWDGNGTFDFGVYRPNTNLWYSSNSDLPNNFGEAGEIPVSTIASSSSFN
jgi:hypothetical protein